MELSIILPCLNESHTIRKVIKDASRLGKAINAPCEIVLADNGSEDSSADIAKAEGARVIHVKRRGYGNAIRKGIASSRYQWLIYADSDGTYRIDEMPLLIGALRHGCDIATGSRIRGKILPGAMPWIHRRIGTPLFGILLRLLFRTRITDPQTGMRAMSRKTWRKLKLKSKGMEINSEMLAKAALLGLKIKEIPITYRRARPGRKSHLRTIADGWRNLAVMLKIRIFGFEH
jgi:glycosyltransferase involved in cell wall biosynthesis